MCSYLSCAGIAITFPSTARAFGPAVIQGEFNTYHWIYCPCSRLVEERN